MNSPKALLRFYGSCLKTNLSVSLEYKVSLVSQALGMLFSNAMWVVFFSAYFERFTLPNWNRADVITLWSVAAAAFGSAGIFFGNAPRLGALIVRGELDAYLLLPKPILLHVLASRMSLVSVGDFIFGFVAFEMTNPSWAQRGLFFLCTVIVTMVVVSFAVMAGSLGFWLGNGEAVATQMYTALINFSTYPSHIFKGWARMIMFLLIPAAYVSGIPVQLLRSPDAGMLALELVAATAMTLGAGRLFHWGLRRYTSGNLMLMRE